METGVENTPDARGEPIAPGAYRGVVIPTCNRASLVPQALESILGQTRPADDIVVDDDSTDGTEKVFQGYADRIRYVWRRIPSVSSGVHKQ